MTEARLVTREQLAAALHSTDTMDPTDRPYCPACEDDAKRIFAALPAAAPAESGYDATILQGYAGPLPAAPAEGLREALERLVDVVGQRVMDGELALAWHDAAVALRDSDAALARHESAGERT